MSRRAALLLALAVTAFVPGAARGDEPAIAEVPGFELRDGDRVVLLGNTLIEREQKYGYWETMLTARYPDRNITFRNLGWDGDTVWAESRGIFDPPAAGYARMLEQVKGLKPTVIFLGYGSNEALAANGKLDAFLKQYEKLLEDLKKVSAEGVRFVIIGPTPFEQKPAPMPDVSRQNVLVRACRSSLQRMVMDRNLAWVDFTPVWSTGYPEFLPSGTMADDGVHLSERGYRHTAAILAMTLATWSHEELTAGSTVIESGKIVRAGGIEDFKVSASEGRLEFTARRRSLEDFEGLAMFKSSVSAEPLVFRSLPLGQFTLRIDGRDTGTAPIANWTSTAPTRAVPPDQEQYEALRQAIIAKNELYFHSWRPQNVTYLFGFRKHEQGQNAKETAEFEKLVAAKEAEIARLKKPVPHKYELVPVKTGKQSP